MGQVVEYVLKVRDEGSPALDGVGDSADGAKENLDDMGGSVDEVGLSIGVMAAAATAAITAITALGAAIYQAAAFNSEYVDDTVILGRTLGISTDAVIALERALEASGSSLQQNSAGIRTFVSNMGDAATGSTEAADKFARLGVAVTDAGGRLRDSDQVMREVLDAIGMLPSATEQAAAAIDVFGGRGAGLVAALGASSESIDQWGEAARRAGLVITDEALVASAAFDASMTSLGITVDAITMKIGQDFTPTVVEATGAMEDFALVSGTALESVSGWFTESTSEIYGGMSRINVALTSAFPLWAYLGTVVSDAADEIRAAVPTFDMMTDALEGYGDGSMLALDPARPKKHADAVKELTKELSPLEKALAAAADEMERFADVIAGRGASSADAALLKMRDAVDSLVAALDPLANKIDSLILLEADLTLAFSRGLLTLDEYEAALSAIDKTAGEITAPDVTSTTTTEGGGALGAVETATSGPTGILGEIDGWVGAIIKAVDGIGKGLLDDIHNFIMGLINTVGNLPSILADAFTRSIEVGLPALVEMIPKFVDGLVNKLIPAIFEMTADVSFWAQLVWSLIKAIAGIIPQLIRGIWENFGTYLTGGISDWWEEMGGLRGIASSIADGVGDWFKGAWETIKAWFGDLVGFFSGSDGEASGLTKTLNYFGGGTSGSKGGDGTGLWEDVANFFWKGENTFAKGGYVPRTTLAAVHAGERIVREDGNPQSLMRSVGRGRGAGGGMTNLSLSVNAPIFTPDAVNELMRMLQQYAGPDGLRPSSLLGGA